jgi:hypothetical protein
MTFNFSNYQSRASLNGLFVWQQLGNRRGFQEKLNVGEQTLYNATNTNGEIHRIVGDVNEQGQFEYLKFLIINKLDNSNKSFMVQKRNIEEAGQNKFVFDVLQQEVKDGVVINKSIQENIESFNLSEGDLDMTIKVSTNPNTGSERGFSLDVSKFHQSNSEQTFNRSISGILGKYLIAPPIFLDQDSPIQLSQEMRYINSHQDGHISFYRQNNKIVAITPGEGSGSSYFQELDQLGQIGPPQKIGLKPILEPTSVDGDFDSNYAGINAVVKGSNPNQLLGFYHGDNTGDGGVTAIGLAISNDNGKTWERMKDSNDRSVPLIEGIQKTFPNGDKIGQVGAGIPSVLVKKEDDGVEYAYIYYQQNVKNLNDNRSNKAGTIQVSRIPLNDLSNKRLDTLSYLQPGGQWASQPAPDYKNSIIPLPPGERTVRNPSITYNTVLKKYVAVYRCESGIYASTSPDGVQWNVGKKILEFPPDMNGRGRTMPFMFYPQLISLDAPDQQTTTKTGFLSLSAGSSFNPNNRGTFWIPFSLKDL